MSSELFLSYSHKDEKFKKELEKQLEILKDTGVIDAWSERKIMAGDDRLDAEIDDRLDRARMILLLVSPDFIASNYCFEAEVKRAIERDESGDARTIPILLRPTDRWQETPFGKLPSLPKYGSAVSLWESDRKEAFVLIGFEIAREILELEKRIWGENHPDLVTSIYHSAKFFKKQGIYEDAEPLFLEALELKRNISGDNNLDIALILNDLAGIYQERGYKEEAEAFYKDALEIEKSILGDIHPDIATSLNHLALLYQSLERYEEAEALYKDAIEMRKQVLGDRDEDVAKAINNLATLYSAQKRYQDALPLYKEALDIVTETLGPDHPSTRTIRKNYDSHKSMSLWKMLQWYIVFQTLYEIFT